MDQDERQPDSRRKEIEQLETLAFHFTQLSKRLAQDREHWTETGKDLNQSVQTLDQHIQHFAGLEKKLRERIASVIQQEIQQAVHTITKTFSQVTQQVLDDQIKTTADHLNRVVQQAGHTLVQHQAKVKGLRTWFLIGITLSALLGNIIAGVTVYYLLPTMKMRSFTKNLEEIRAMEEREKKQNSLLSPSRGQNKPLK